MLHDIALMLKQTQKAEIQTQFNLGHRWGGWASDTPAHVCVCVCRGAGGEGVALPSRHHHLYRQVTSPPTTSSHWTPGYPGGQTPVFMPRDNGQNSTFQAGETAQPKVSTCVGHDGQQTASLSWSWLRGEAPPAMFELMPASGPLRCNLHPTLDSWRSESIQEVWQESVPWSPCSASGTSVGHGGRGASPVSTSDLWQCEFGWGYDCPGGCRPGALAPRVFRLHGQIAGRLSEVEELLWPSWCHRRGWG